MTKATKPPIGRPSDYSEEFADLICSKIANGQGLVKICKEEGMPARSTVMLWLFKNKSFSDKYAQARESQADYYFEEMLEIADTTDGDMLLDKDGNPTGKVNHENINRSRLRVDTRKWIVARLAPKKYGDRVEFDAEDNNWTVNGIPVKTR
jgi:hypothetical protein